MGIRNANFTTKYNLHLQHAITLLQTWCNTSRMAFGQKKTQIVVFTGRQKQDLTPFAGKFHICGFAIDLSPTYRYLGLHIQFSLSWRTHIDTVRQQARQAASRVSRIVTNTHRVANFNVVKTLVQAYLIPSFSYGILFWGPHLSASDISSFQARIALPLRNVLGLPTTTHQLSVLEMCGIPTIRALLVRIQLGHECRVKELPHSHPTRLLHHFCLARAKDKDPHIALIPHYVLSVAVNTAVCVLPKVCFDGRLASTLPEFASLEIEPLSNWGKGNELFQQKNADRRTWSKAHYKRHHLNSTLRWVGNAIKGFTPPLACKVRDLVSHAEWRAQHALPVVAAAPAPPSSSSSSSPSPPPPPTIPHSTNNPLTRAKPGPGMCAFLHRHSSDSIAQQIRRARLATGRSYTNSTIARFQQTTNPDSTPAPRVAPLCTFRECTAEETIDHMLLICPRYRDARATLAAALLSLTTPLPLTLTNILCTFPAPLLSRPSGATSHHMSAHLQPFLLHLTYSNDFLDSLSSLRAAEALPHLDTG